MLDYLIGQKKKRGSLLLKKSFIKWRKICVLNKLEKAGNIINYKLINKLRGIHIVNNRNKHSILRELFNSYLSEIIIKKGFSAISESLRTLNGFNLINNLILRLIFRKISDYGEFKLLVQRASRKAQLLKIINTKKFLFKLNI